MEKDGPLDGRKYNIIKTAKWASHSKKIYLKKTHIFEK